MYILVAEIKSDFVNKNSGQSCISYSVWHNIVLALCIRFSVCVDILDVAKWLATDWTLHQPLGTAVARHVMAARAEDGRDPGAHADLAETLILDVE